MSFKQKILIAIALIIVGILGRLLPHLWNMTPMAGIAILAGAKFGWKWGVIVPILGMTIGDFIIGFYSLPVLLSVYISLGLAGVLGNGVSKYKGVTKILGASLLSTMVFFFFTNAMVWAYGTMYPHNILGLFLSYFAGLPFLQNQIIGDLFFTSMLFTTWEMGKVLNRKFKFVEFQVDKNSLPNF